MKTDPEFSCLVPPLSREELDALEASIMSRGCREPLVVWKGEDILLDGHNRLAICKKHGIEFRTVEYEFADRAAARNWIIDNQLSRRNLAPQQASYLRGKKYLGEKRDEGRPEKRSQSGHVSPERTAEKVAASTGVSAKTIQRDAEFASAVDVIAQTCPRAKAAILSGEVKLTREQVQRVAAKAPRSMTQVKAAAKGRGAPKRATLARDYIHEINTLALRTSAAIESLKKAGVESVESSRLSGLWELRSEIDALREALAGQE